MEKKKIKFGILGASIVAPRVLIQPSLEIDNVEVIAISSRSKEKATKFATDNKIPRVYYNYQDLLDDKEIDAVYIPLPNSLHTEHIIKAAEAGKHILVEKPICIRPEDFSIIERALALNNICLLEALMVQHHPWVSKIQEIIKNGKYGEIKVIETEFCFIIKEQNINSYRYYPELGGGVFFDTSIYWLHLVQICLGLSPIFYNGISKFDGPNRIDQEFTAKMSFENGAEAKFYTSYRKPYVANHTIKFDNAELFIRMFTRPLFGHYHLYFKIIRKDGEIETVVFPAQNYYYNQLNFFIDVINNSCFNISLKESFERISMMRSIYNLAQSHAYI